MSVHGVWCVSLSPSHGVACVYARGVVCVHVVRGVVVVCMASLIQKPIESTNME